MAEDVAVANEPMESAGMTEGGLADLQVAATEPEPARVSVRDEFGRSYATGKRKEAVARVWIKPGSGRVVVNGKDMDVYFARPVQQMIMRQPFKVAGVDGEFDVMATGQGRLYDPRSIPGRRGP